MQELKRVEVDLLLRKKIKKTKVAKIVGVHLNTVTNIAKRGKKNRRLARKVGSGRNKKLNFDDKISIRRALRANPFLSAQQIVDNQHLSCSARTLRRYLNSAGFDFKKPVNIQPLTEEQKNRRLAWCIAHKNYPYFGDVIWTDETSIWLNDNDHKGWFHSDFDNELSLNKHSGKVHAFGGISIQGQIVLVTFRINHNSANYVEILNEDYLPASRQFHPDGHVFMQDSSPIHTSGMSMGFIKANMDQILDWPKYSPDLNPIENIWAILKRNVRKRLPKNVDELENFIHEEWQKIDTEIIIRACESIEARIDKCIQVNGKRINY